MATQENGIPTNITLNFPASVSIASSTNAAPIVVTTSVPHLMTSGDWCTIEEHAVNTVANGTFAVNVLSATTFQLLGTTGTGVGGATGIVQPLGLGPTFAIPADGVDNLAAASVNVPFNALADRTAFLGVSLGSMKLAHLLSFTRTDLTIGSYDTITVAATTTWTFGAVIWNPTEIDGGGGGANFTMPSDQLYVDASINITTIGTAGTPIGQIALWYAIVPPGGAVSFAVVPGSAKAISAIVGTTTYSTINLAGIITPGNPGGQLRLRAGVYDISGTMAVNLVGDVLIKAQQYRPTTMPQ